MKPRPAGDAGRGLVAMMWERKLRFEHGQYEDCVVALTATSGHASYADVVVHGDFVVDVLDSELGGAPASEANLRLEVGAAHAGPGDGFTGDGGGVHGGEHVGLDDGCADGSVEDGSADIAEVADGIVSVDVELERGKHLCYRRGDEQAEFGGINRVEGFVLGKSTYGIFHAVDDSACQYGGDSRAGCGVVDGDEVAGAVLIGGDAEVELVRGGAVFAGVGAAENATTVATVGICLEAVFTCGFVFDGADDNLVGETGCSSSLLLTYEVEVEHEVVGLCVVVVVEGDFVVELAGFEAEVSNFELVEAYIFFVVYVFVHFGVAEAGEAVILTLRVGDFRDVGEESGLGLGPVVLPLGSILGMCQIDEFFAESDHGCSIGLYEYYEV